MNSLYVLESLEKISRTKKSLRNSNIVKRDMSFRSWVVELRKIQSRFQ